MSRPFSSRRSTGPIVRINGRIRAREVRVVTEDGRQIGVIGLADAIRLAQSRGVDLVEVAPNAEPPVCRLVDFGKYRYELAKREKEARKHQHSTKLKEIQLRPAIDPHDRQTKLSHAIDFLCEDMKVKLSLRFKGREMAHKEIGLEVMEKFIADLAPYGHPDAEPKMAGRNVNVMLSPLPRNKRAKNPNGGALASEEPAPALAAVPDTDGHRRHPPSADFPGSAPASPGFVNNPFSELQT